MLLRETSWMNARKVVEPVCLDVLVKWRGDEETGRDQMDEILREVVVITDSEYSDDSSDETETSEDETEDEGNITSASSGAASQSNSRNQLPSARPSAQDVDLESPVKFSHGHYKGNEKAQRGFKRYQAAWDEARIRQQHNGIIPEATNVHATYDASVSVQMRYPMAHDALSRPVTSLGSTQDDGLYYKDAHNATRSVSVEKYLHLPCDAVLFMSASTNDNRPFITHSNGPFQNRLLLGMRHW
jgi:hypothetical protein